MPGPILFALILSNLVWSLHPAMGKWALESFTPTQAAWLRYSSAWLAFLLLRPLVARLLRDPRREPHWVSPALPDRWRIVGLGLLPFCLSPLLQLTGLSLSRATDNAVIVAMEPLLTASLGWWILHERLRGVDFLGLALALTGFFLLSTSAVSFSASLGNAIMLISLFGEASYSVLGRDLVRRYRVLPLFGTSLGLGVLGLTVALGVSVWLAPPASLAVPSMRSVFGILWLGPLGTAAVYLLWMKVLTRIDVSKAAPTLFIQPVMGVVWGVLFLGERLSPLQGLGACVILLGILLPTALFSIQKKTL